MDIPLDATVRCAGEECGTSVALVLDPAKEEVTHVVIEEKERPHSQLLVPVSYIAEASEDGIDLSCTAEELAGMDRFVDTEMEQVEVPHYVNTSMYNSMAYIFRETEIKRIPVKEEHVPEGEMAIQRGADVEATDGRVGKVDEFVIDPDTDSVTHLVMREGHLWAKKDVMIPVAKIDKYLDNTVYLKMSKEEIEKLPEASTAH